MYKITITLLGVLLILTSTYAISTCQEIKGENLFLTLDDSIDGGQQTCFYIEGINITLDCGNYYIYNSSTAILINNSHSINIYNCNIENSTNGIVVQVQTPITNYDERLIRRNTSAFLINTTINNATNGIFLNRSHLNTIRFANINNSQASLSLFHSYANLIENSSFSNNQVGIWIYDVSANRSQQNATPVFSKAKRLRSANPQPLNNTIVMRGKYGSVIRHSIFQNNSIGIKLNQTANNSIYNNLFNSTQNVISDSFAYTYINYWNSSYDCSQRSIIDGICRGGNYWNDYYGYDDGSGTPPHDVYFDDIGDSLIPYIPDGEVSGDNLPLTHEIPPDWIADCRNITEPGQYTVKRDIYGVISRTNHICIHVLADNVSLNCDGFNITDNTTYTDSYGIYISNYANLTITNCTVNNYTYGVYQKNSDYGLWDNNRFSNDLYNVYFDFDWAPYNFSFYEKNITSNNYVYDKKMYYYLNGRTGDGIPLSAGIPADAGFIGIVHYNSYDITGFNLRNNTPLILLVNVSNISVHENTFNFSGHAIRIHNATNFSATQNYNLGSGGTLYALYSNYVNSSRNGLFSSGGNYFWYTDNYVITYNTGNMTHYLLIAYGSQNGTIHDNYLNGSSSAWGGIRLNDLGWSGRRCGNVEIYNNQLHFFCQTPGRGIITTRYSDNIYISSNNGTWGNCPPYSSNGLFIAILQDTVNGTIFNHTLYGFRNPIQLIHAANFTVYNNSVSSWHGYPDGTGITLAYSDYNLVYDNYINDTDKGIRTFISQNRIFNNTITNSGFGIYLDFSAGNYLYNNYLANNTQNTYDDYWADTWNLPEGKNCSRGPNIIGGACWGGNYYDDYTGCDSDGDGIGETPYPIPGGGGRVDNYPLTNTACKHKGTFDKVVEKNQNLPPHNLNKTIISLPPSISIH